MLLLEGRWDSLEDILPSVLYYNATFVTPRSSLQRAWLISRKQLCFWAHSFCNLKNWSGFSCRRCPKQLGSISSWAWHLDRTAKCEQACEHALHLRNIVKSRRARGTREETRKRRAGEWLSDCRELLLNKKIRDLFFRIFDAEESYVPRGFAARSRALQRFASLAQIGKLARRLSTNLW